MQTVLEAIRKTCLPGVWSQAVKLARDGAVTAGAATPDELTFRVRAAGHAIALTVTLYVVGPEWTCDCDGKSNAPWPECLGEVRRCLQKGFR